MADDADSRTRLALNTFGGVVGSTGVSILIPGLKDAILAWLNRSLNLHLSPLPPWVGALLLVVAVLCLLLAFFGQPRIASALVWLFDGHGSSVGTVLAVKHVGFVPAVRNIKRQELPTKLRRWDLRHLVIDLSTDLIASPPSLEAALAKQLRLPDQIAGILATNPNADLAYCGIVHAPFQLLAGYQLSSWTSLYFFEWHRHDHRWIALQPGSGPDLKTTARTVSLKPKGHVVIAIEVSYAIPEPEITASFPDVGAIIKVSVATPTLDCITHEGQVDEIARLFRVTLDGTRRLDSCTEVHVCCAAPMSVGVGLGRMVSRTLHPPVRVYAYDRAAAKPYAWGIEVNGASGPGQMVRN